MRFNQWAQKFGFAHESPAMQEKRLHIFQNNVEQIDAQNEKFQNGQSSYHSDINRFTGMTEEEKKQFTGHRDIQVDKKRSLSANQVKYSGTTYTAFIYTNNAAAAKNTYKNWTTVYTAPAENQGQCGSCWTFAATSVIDAAYKIKLGQTVATSKECLLECSKVFNNQCHGGNALMAFDYVQVNGIASAAAYPYVSANLTDQPAACKTAISRTYATVKKYFVINDASEETMRQAVDEYGPIAVSIDASSALQSYAAGIFDGACTTSANHAVVIVGYGVEAGIPYWIVRNSWGSNANPSYYPYTINYVDATGKIVNSVTTYKAVSWGENGHFRIRRGVNKCGITSAPYGVLVQ